MDESWPRSPRRVSGARADARTDPGGHTGRDRAQSAPLTPAPGAGGLPSRAPRGRAPHTRPRVPRWPGAPYGPLPPAPRPPAPAGRILPGHQGEEDVPEARGPGWGGGRWSLGLGSPRPGGGRGRGVANVALLTYYLGGQKSREPLAPTTPETTPPKSCRRRPQPCTPLSVRSPLPLFGTFTWWGSVGAQARVQVRRWGVVWQPHPATPCPGQALRPSLCRRRKRAREGRAGAPDPACGAVAGGSAAPKATDPNRKPPKLVTLGSVASPTPPEIGRVPVGGWCFCRIGFPSCLPPASCGGNRVLSLPSPPQTHTHTHKWRSLMPSPHQTQPRGLF